MNIFNIFKLRVLIQDGVWTPGIDSHFDAHVAL